jgi:hypothetical protein
MLKLRGVQLGPIGAGQDAGQLSVKLTVKAAGKGANNP